MSTLAIGTDVAAARRGGERPVTPAPVLQEITLGTQPPRVGQLLRCDVTWTASSPVELFYQWLLDGTAVHLATGASFTPTAGSEGKRLSCRITIIYDGGVVTGESASFTVLTAPLPVVLVIVAGQSNAQAAETSAANAPAAYALLNNAWMWVSGSGFAPYVIGVNSDNEGKPGGSWGSEAEFIHQMNLRYPGRSVYVVKEAVNGTYMAAIGSTDSWSPTVGNGLFKKLETQVAAVRSALAATNVAFEEVTLFNQGEADTVLGTDNGTGSGTRADVYKANFAAFLTAYRTRISSSKFILERIRPYSYDLVTRPYAQTYKVRQAQEEIAIEFADVEIISLDFTPGNFNQLHPGAVWAEQKGLRCFSAWIGEYQRDFGAVDTTVPAPFPFDALTGVEANKPTTSSTVAVHGLGQHSPISVTGGEYRVRNPDDTDWLAWTTAVGTIHPFQKAQLRVTSAVNAGGSVSVTLTIGGVASIWTVSTTAAITQREAETVAFAAKIAAGTGNPMSTAQTLALDFFYATAKASSWWPKVRRLYVGGLHDIVAASIDLKDQSTMLTQSGNSGTVAWTLNSGWGAGGNSGRGLNMHFSPSTDLQNSLALFLWCPDFGITSTASSSFDIQSADFSVRLRQNELGNLQCRLNSGANQTRTQVANTPGFRCASRTAASATWFYGADGAPLGTTPDSTASITPTSSAVHMFAPGTGSTSKRQLLVAGISEGLDKDQVLGLRNALTALGSGFWLI